MLSVAASSILLPQLSLNILASAFEVLHFSQSFFFRKLEVSDFSHGQQHPSAPLSLLLFTPLHQNREGLSALSCSHSLVFPSPGTMPGKGANDMISILQLHYASKGEII